MATDPSGHRVNLAIVTEHLADAVWFVRRRAGSRASGAGHPHRGPLRPGAHIYRSSRSTSTTTAPMGPTSSPTIPMVAQPEIHLRAHLQRLQHQEHVHGQVP